MIEPNEPLIVTVLMIKNESSSIKATLSSYLAPGLTSFFVFDTGSTDDTLQLVQTFFQENKVTGHIQQEPFIDFATSRNRALTLAESHFPNAVFFIMPDAEWHLQGGKALIEFCERERKAETPLYLINIQMHSTEFTTARLFRAANQIRFKGVVHEAPDALAVIKAPASIYFEVKASTHGIEKSKRRWQQDLLILSKAYHENTQDPRTAFYLAQTYECLGLLENAYQMYQHRSTLHGWDEENFITYFRLGCLAEKIMNQQGTISWETAMSHFLKAFALRPHRIEPLVKIADYYWPNNIPSCYLFIKHAYDMPYPAQDVLFIEKQMYLYDRYEIMSRAAWYMGEYSLGEKATLLALKIHPNMAHLHKNLALYQEKLTHRTPENLSVDALVS